MSISHSQKLPGISILNNIDHFRDYDDFESNASVSTTLPRRPPKPPKLQHVLKGNKTHDLVKAVPRDEDTMEAPDFSDYGEDYRDQYYKTFLSAFKPLKFV